MCAQVKKVILEPQATPFGEKIFFCLKSKVVGYQSAQFDIYKAIKQKELHKNNYKLGK